MERGRIEKLIEFHEMVSLNDADLKSAENRGTAGSRGLLIFRNAGPPARVIR